MPLHGDACLQELRKSNLWRLYIDSESGRLDPDVKPLLSKLWARGYVTVSSCSGRIALKATRTGIEDKRGGGVLRAWHVEPPTVDDLWRLASSAASEYKIVWVSVEPPIVALYASSSSDAEMLVRAAVSAGLKYSCYRSSSCGFYVVLRGETRLDILLAVDGELVLDRGGLERAYSVLLEVFKRGKRVLHRLVRAVDW
ncbi:hypothetical protein Pyrfu_1978 [Pyrolobus fumarii 1A]|uniref:tRNA(Phe) 7-((3-amino-3-carboxypropyl)-4-demethylwyosine(37)-N(4))-methyltransferase n=1 Tax=Pyrolobus fumarii (strain DSM 11204 / 1A) TaxID=694429 RepID=G0EDM7_PYRF1|nr:hypothetical protein [Pyrolobus fumarii]AEM39831.1 hypothetical protein Pyrfu_1978 [Pyrolobus fumarii 1A]